MVVPAPTGLGALVSAPREQPAPLAPATAPGYVPQAADLPDPGPIRTRVVVLVLGSALLLLGGLRRLPDEVLRHTPRECLLEEGS